MKLTKPSHEKIHSFSSDWQAAAGDVPLIPAGPAFRETTIPDPFQSVGSCAQSDSVLGGSLLLPSAASDRNRHTDGHLLHPKGCVGYESYGLSKLTSLSRSLSLLVVSLESGLASCPSTNVTKHLRAMI